MNPFLSLREQRIQVFFLIKSACRGGNNNESGQQLASCANGALEKQENQMVVKHRTGKPKSGISVFSGSLGASTLLFAFSFLFFQLVVWVLGVCQEAHSCNPR